MQANNKGTVLPPSLGIPSPDTVMKSTTPTRGAGLIPGNQPAPKPKRTDQPLHVFSLADFVETPATTQSSLGSRASDGRNLSRPSLPREGYRKDAWGKSGKSGQAKKGAAYGKSEKGAFLPQKRSPKSVSKEWGLLLGDSIFPNSSSLRSPLLCLSTLLFPLLRVLSSCVHHYQSLVCPSLGPAFSFLPLLRSPSFPLSFAYPCSDRFFACDGKNVFFFFALSFLSLLRVPAPLCDVCY